MARSNKTFGLCRVPPNQAMRKDLNASVYLFGGRTGENRKVRQEEGRQYRDVSKQFTAVVK